MIDLRLGRWQDVLKDVECDACIMDPQYSARTHAGHDAAGRRYDGASAVGLGYAAMDAAGVGEVVSSWSPRTRAWMAAMTSHDLVPAWEAAFEASGRYCFAPVPIVDRGSRVRLQGDGPSGWCVWMVVARPRTATMAKWGTLPGVYERSPGDERSPRMGGKPLGVMRAIIRDYSRLGDLVCDPFAGGGTTLLAAAIEGRLAVGSEMDAEAHAEALARWNKGHQTSMWTG